MQNRALEFLRIYPDLGPAIEDLPYELVERKGIGHPDTMCDAIAERASRYYSQHCLDEYGRVAHHWFDKVVLHGGEAVVEHGRGELVRPYQVTFYGKGAYAVGADPIPLTDILFRAAADVLAEVTTGFEAKRHLEVRCEVVDHQGAGRAGGRYRPESADELVEIGAAALVSNDCNLLHGYAPLSRLETLVLGVEQLVNGPTFKNRNPDTGWDVKVFGSRRGEHFRLIVNMPFLAKDVRSLEDYFERKQQCAEQIAEFTERTAGLRSELLLNPTDRNGRAYLTALGSVADTGDVGVVGRGNRINGLITPMRSMSIEAPAGKNPLDHTGKLYGILAHQLAAELSTALSRPVETHVFTSKEAPLGRPDEVVVRVRDWADDPAERGVVEKITRERVEAAAGITYELVLDGITMW